MAQQTVSIGSSANDGTGDPLRTAFTKINTNFTELYGDTAEANDILDDTTPQLGGNLDLNTNTISGSGNIKFSGSLEVSTVNATDDFFLLKSGSLNALKVNNEGVLKLGEFTFIPTVVSGGFYYNKNDDEFYLGKT